jgi:quercetin dioxygenase-like cupin family protein
MENSIMGNASSLLDLIDYQSGSVVSRTLIKKDTGTVTIFAFDEGEGLSEHTAPFDALVYIYDGEAEISIDKKPQIVKKDQMIIMPADKPHSLKAIQKFKMLLVMVKK